ncbi:hypothetical protein HYFRA_00014206 [Hymenoscyphus fraxineus]|uniref:Uncharacterized protein n=1 Tax=Hymenoscyphus fraxineus TaxID=746836 RepID=A0A9N9LE22_9HELO|nr:hypothetical protein HYFRA_00014206 [Hymenoscyphus fraxineus]
MGVENLNISRVVRLVIIFLVVDLLIYSGVVLHPSYSKFIGDEIPLAKKEDTATQQPLSPTHSTISLLLGESASPNTAFGDQHEAKGALDGGNQLSSRLLKVKGFGYIPGHCYTMERRRRTSSSDYRSKGKLEDYTLKGVIRLYY